MSFPVPLKDPQTQEKQKQPSLKVTQKRKRTTALAQSQTTGWPKFRDPSGPPFRGPPYPRQDLQVLRKFRSSQLSMDEVMHGSAARSPKLAGDGGSGAIDRVPLVGPFSGGCPFSDLLTAKNKKWVKRKPNQTNETPLTKTLRT